MAKTSLSKIELKKIRQAIVDEQKKKGYKILDGSDSNKLESLFNFAVLNKFGIDIFDNDD